MVPHGLNEPLREQSISGQCECRAGHEQPRETSCSPTPWPATSARGPSAPRPLLAAQGRAHPSAHEMRVSAW